MVNVLAKIPVQVRKYVKENWGAPFIVFFMLLLMTAAVSLSMGLVALADNVAVYAYCALVVGIISQFFCYLKLNKTTGERE
jgi:uncharacterized membrane protein